MVFARILTTAMVLFICLSAPDARANMAPPPAFGLGLTLEMTAEGPRVKSLEKGGAAASSGVQVGDLILGIDQRYAKTMSEEDLEAFAEDSHIWPIELIVARGDSIVTLRIAL